VTREEFAIAVREQAAWCERLQSPLYAKLLTRMAIDVEHGGPSWTFLCQYADEPARSLVPLRFLAMLHRRALAGNWPELARYLPSCGGTADPDGAWDAIQRLELSGEIPSGVQTNEVGRSCALVPGFLETVRQTGLPLALLEIGTSAGLNLRWDHYRYGDRGAPDAEVAFPEPWTGAPAKADVRIVERRGCDLNPIDVTTTEGRLDLLSFVWPDQLERFELLDRAIATARRVPAELERADAADWAERQLSIRREGVATVLFHSVMWLYLSDAARDRITSAVYAAGERSTRSAPVVWLSMEAGQTDQAEIALTIWPGGERRVIAHSTYHGKNVVILPGKQSAQ
jgi:hypothetical protein